MMPAAGRGTSIGVRVGSSTKKAVIKAKAQISLYLVRLLAMASKSYCKIIFFENRGILGVVSYADCRLAYLEVIA